MWQNKKEKNATGKRFANPKVYQSYKATKSACQKLAVKTVSDSETTSYDENIIREHITNVGKMQDHLSQRLP